MEYTVLDKVKFLMALEVVLIHTQPWQSLGSEWIANACNILTDSAVPFFFMASGFLLFRKVKKPFGEEGAGRFSVYMKKITSLFLIWTFLYLPVTLYGEFVVYNVSVEKGILKMIRNFLFVGNDYNGWHLWYLHGLLIAGGLTWLLLKAGMRIPQITAVAALCFLTGILLDYMYAGAFGASIPVQKLSEIYFAVFQTTRNGIFHGFLYFTVGGCVAYRKREIRPGLTAAIAVCGYLGGYLLYDSLFLRKLLVCMASISIFVLVIVLQKKGRKPCRKFRRASVVIYLVHMLFYSLFVDVLTKGKTVYGWKVCIFTLAGSLIVAAFVVGARENGKYPFLSTIFPD